MTVNDVKKLLELATANGMNKNVIKTLQGIADNAGQKVHLIDVYSRDIILCNYAQKEDVCNFLDSQGYDTSILTDEYFKDLKEALSDETDPNFYDLENEAESLYEKM